MKTAKWWSGFLLLAAMLCWETSAFGQARSSLRGVITDPSGGVVAGASAVLSNPETGFTRTTLSAADGVYQFLEVPPGTYSLTVNAQGFKAAKLNSVQLLVNTPPAADVVLSIGASTEVVTVSTEAATLNTEDATVGNPFQQNQVKQLPIESRNVVDLLSLQTSVVYLCNRRDID